MEIKNANKRLWYNTYRPELNEVLERRKSYVNAVCEWIADEEDEEFVIWKSNTVVDPCHTEQNNQQQCVKLNEYLLYS